ncbi:hypothetical protein MPSEU_000219500 [Mayamaea pseudoterrestris]|nr:hypothetical protein MPSEU_000219500 [Mayamaea pseudoterrestris]
MEECGQCSAACVDMTAALLSSTSYQSVESWSTVRKEHFVFLHLLAMYKSGGCSAMCVYANAKLLLTGANRPAQLLGADNDAQAQNDHDDDDDEAVSPACMLMEHAIIERLLTLMVTGERSMDFVLFAAKLLFDDEAGLIHNILIHPGTTPDNFIKSLDPGYFHE